MPKRPARRGGGGPPGRPSGQRGSFRGRRCALDLRPCRSPPGRPADGRVCPRRARSPAGSGSAGSPAAAPTAAACAPPRQPPFQGAGRIRPDEGVPLRAPGGPVRRGRDPSGPSGPGSSPTNRARARQPGRWRRPGPRLRIPRLPASRRIIRSRSVAPHLPGAPYRLLEEPIRVRAGGFRPPGAAPAGPGARVARPEGGTGGSRRHSSTVRRSASQTRSQAGQSARCARIASQREQAARRPGTRTAG